MASSKTVPIDYPRTSIRMSQAWTFDESRRIGTGGGVGDVFEGWDPDGSPVAVKRIRLDKKGLVTGEVRTARKVMAEHPEHVIRILDAGTDELSRDYFVIMPRAKESLQHRLDQDGPMVDEDAMGVLCDVLLGLSEMDDVVHGDLKPGNVLLHDNKWQLSDMGLARLMPHTAEPRPEPVSGNEAYTAPEQWQAQSPTRATDVYAFGCLAYAVLTGQPPFPGPTRADYHRQHLNETPRPLPASAPVQALIQMCLTKERGARPSIGTALVLLRRAWSKKK